MFLLDTNSFDLYLRGNANVVRQIEANLRSVFISSIVVEEKLTGRISFINLARKENNSLSVVRAHEDLMKTQVDLRLFPVLTYSDAADAVYTALPAKAKRAGTQDCRIAAQAIAHGLTVVTCDADDFSVIGAPFVDWSA